MPMGRCGELPQDELLRRITLPLTRVPNRKERGQRPLAFLHLVNQKPPSRAPCLKDRRSSVSLSLQVHHRRASLRKRRRKGGVAAILDLDCACVLRLAADDAV